MNNTQHCNVINSPNKLITPLLILSILFVNSCSTSQVVTTHKEDPYENFNRSMFTFNDRIDGYLAKPISDGYKYITPELLQTGVYNFYNNLKNVNIVINDSLQGKFSQSAQDSGRLALNSTLGLAGFFDVAKSVGWEQNEEDFDQTMAVWGVPAGSYLVLPRNNLATDGKSQSSYDLELDDELESSPKDTAKKAITETVAPKTSEK